MRIVFLGSPSFALPSLKALMEQYSVQAVICQPDRPAGRGRQPAPPATKEFALESGIIVLQPARIKDADSLSQIAELEPDIMVVAAYGQILPQSLLDIPEFGSLNVHASLLPRWRGAAPVQAAIRNGDPDSGVTIMLMDAGLDTGPILSQRKIQLAELETGGSLTERLALLGADLLVETIPGYVAGDVIPQPQDDNHATYAPMLKKSDGALDLSNTAEQLAQQVRAYDPWPGTFIIWKDRRLAIKQAHAVPTGDAVIGEVVLRDGIPAIGTGAGFLVLDAVQSAGKRMMSGADFARGAPEFVGTGLTV